MPIPDYPKTAAMEALEAVHGAPIDVLIRDRYEAGESQRQIAEVLGVNVATVSRYMRAMGLPVRRYGWTRTVRTLTHPTSQEPAA